MSFIIGLFFGFLLQRSGFGHSRKIRAQFIFADNSMLKFMLSALAFGMITISIFKSAGMLNPASMPDTYPAGNLIGGALLGIGMGIAGVCPGTLIAGTGQGNVDYLIPGWLGFITGGFIFGYFFNPYFLTLTAKDMSKGVTLSSLTGVNHWVFTLLTLVVVIALYFLMRRRKI
jgi:uncharacterized membrane protein YedE/YeeE